MCLHPRFNLLQGRSGAPRVVACAISFLAYVLSRRQLVFFVASRFRRPNESGRFGRVSIIEVDLCILIINLSGGPYDCAPDEL